MPFQGARISKCLVGAVRRASAYEVAITTVAARGRWRARGG